MALLASTIPSEASFVKHFEFLDKLPACFRAYLMPQSIFALYSCTIGIALPVYNTFKAIEKKDQSEQEKWLLYWAAYGSFSLVETFADKIISWIPFYYHMKFAFLIWLQFPSGNGSAHLYVRHLRPFLLKHQDHVDRLLNFYSKQIAKFVKNHEGEIQFIKAVGKRFALTGGQVVKDVIHPVQSGAPSNAIEGRHSSTDDLDLSSESDSES